MVYRFFLPVPLAVHHSICVAVFVQVLVTFDVGTGLGRFSLAMRCARSETLALTRQKNNTIS